MELLRFGDDARVATIPGPERADQADIFGCPLGFAPMREDLGVSEHPGPTSSPVGKERECVAGI